MSRLGSAKEVEKAEGEQEEQAMDEDSEDSVGPAVFTRGISRMLIIIVLGRRS